MDSLKVQGRILAVVAVVIVGLFAVAVALLMSAPSAVAEQFGAKFAATQIVDARGEAVGTALLTQRKESVRVFVWTRGLTPGKHGIHIHAVGRCDAATFASAGGHFNPETRQHGLENPAGAHGGDLPNLEVRENGIGILHATNDRISLLASPSSIFDADGSALIIHAAEDDQVTDPTGNSGARIACGVIEARQ
jgi:superoxide dismutase, Cu-Zn family